MLTSLYIKHYALIEEISVEFEKGLTIITGETGAGKSILIDALGLLLGERASAEAVRSGTEKAIVEGTFTIGDVPRVKDFLRQNEYEESNSILIRREVSAKGTSRCFINDSPVSLGQLKDIGDMLVDLHGQHEHQSLLRSETHHDFLDDFGGCEKEIATYRQSYRLLIELTSKKKECIAQEEQLSAKKSLYEFQIKEIDAVAPVADEEAQLENELKILENSEKLSDSTSQLNKLLYESDTSLHDTLVLVRKQLEILTQIDAAFGDAVGEAKSAEIIIEELSKFVQKYNSNIEFNPVRLEELRQRLGQLSLLKKKYGGTLGAVIAHREKIGEEVSLAENFEVEIARLEKEIAVARDQCGERAQKLSTLRKEAGKKIEKAILASLTELGIAKAKFEVLLLHTTVAPLAQLSIDEPRRGVTPYVVIGKNKIQATSNGIDSVEFFISTNVGEEVKPLAKVASGGEVSRIMLALKSALAHSDKTPLLIFDEIDTGVSGRIGQAVGLSLKKLSSLHQVIAITHLPQIAALAETHFAVEKIEEDKHTFTRLRKLEKDERVREVAKLMSGAEVTEAGLKSARELMGIK